jgi:UDP-2-acetamido-3-amino-2,3-dideoxy-glucuronate N-acetyltransferase
VSRSVQAAGPRRALDLPLPWRGLTITVRSVIADDVRLGRNVVIPQPDLVNLYGCEIGDNCKIGAFVEIQRGVILGKNVKVEAFAFIPSGVTVEDGAFIGPHVCFTNDRYPRAVDEDGSLLKPGAWTLLETRVGRRASIGANATILCGLVVGEGALVAAGSVVTKNVPAGCLVVGSPARVVRSHAGSQPGEERHP